MAHAEAPARIEVEVVCSPTPGVVDRRRLLMPAGSTVADALKASSVLERHPQFKAATGQVGIHGRACRLDAVLCEGDRVELYRELRVDPKEARRERYRGQGGRKSR